MDKLTPLLPRLDLVPVRDVMHAGLVGCDPAASLPTIARIFAEERIHCVVVNGIERTRAGERLTWGIVSDRDLIRALDATDTSITAGTLASPALMSVTLDESLDHAVRIMASFDVTHVLVLEDDYPVGIVSAMDIARAAGGV
jgi:CBS domain-containing protein